MKQRGFEIIKDKPPTSEKELEYKARLSDDIADFYARGGVVEICKSVEATPSYVYKAWNNIGLREVL